MKNLITILCLCLSLNFVLACIDEEEVELWGECYNIEWTTHLYLAANELTGEIPFEIGQLINLEHLHLYNNQLTGEIPESIGNLINLENLQLFNNQLTGEIPESIGNLINLNSLVIYNNQFTGEIPSGIGNLINVYFLYLNDNQLTGQIPSNICNIGDTAPSLFNNQLCPPYPNCISQSNIDTQDTSECFIECIDGEEVELWGECYNIEETTIINRFDDNLSGDIPESIGLLTNLISIILPFNELTGEIPESFENLSELRVIDLRDNQMIGETNIIGNLMNLEAVFLSNNSFEGELTYIGNLSNLIEFDVANNNLTGAIPESIGNLLFLEKFSLYNNNFYGELPDQVTNLNRLILFSLFNNQFEGQIPLDICGINTLEYIIIENNKFCPPYPECIEYIGYQDTTECLFCDDGYVPDCNGDGDCCPESWIGDGWCDDGELSTACNLICYDEELSDCNECPDSIEGDTNYNGYVNISDIMIVISCVLANNCSICFDINYDENIDIIDIMIMVNIILNN